MRPLRLALLALLVAAPAALHGPAVLAGTRPLAEDPAASLLAEPLGELADLAQRLAGDAAILAAAPPGGEALLCILDSGVDPGHVDLDEGKVVAWADFVQGRRVPYDDNGHGTHVAGIAAGSGEAGAAGPAAAARLAVAKVLDAEGEGTSRAAILGLRWCVAQGASVVNLSLEEDDCRGRQGLDEAVTGAVEQGLLVVVAAGNRGTAPCAIHTPGSLAEALTVGALGRGGDVAPFSGRGGEGPSKPDLVAPGVRVLAARAGTERGLAAMDGTSMAAPHVAGLAWALRAAVPQAPPALVAEALRATARDGGPPGPDPSWGWGEPDAAAARAWLERRTTLAGDAGAALAELLAVPR